MTDDLTFIDRVWGWLVVLASLAGAVWMKLDGVYQVLVVLMVSDVVTGVMRALKDKQTVLNSKLAYVDMLKKTGMLMLVAVSAYIQKIIPESRVIPLPELVAGFYIYVEGLTLLENLSELGVPIPAFLRRIIESFNTETPEPEPEK
jgi:toxin secretion/phage lysis holin